MSIFLSLLGATPPLETTSDTNQSSWPIWSLMFILVLVVVIITAATASNQRNNDLQKRIDEALSQKVVLICCPVCGCRELAFVAEYRREIGLRIARDIALLGVLAMLIKDFVDIFQMKASSWGDGWFVAGIITLGLLALYLHIRILITESQSHVQAICRDCGFSWRYQ